MNKRGEKMQAVVLEILRRRGEPLSAYDVLGDPARNMESLLARCDAGELSLDRSVIETTGLADPGPILQTLPANPPLARRTRMDGVVTAADVANGPATLNAPFEAASQAATADRNVLSKTGLVAPERAMIFKERLGAIDPGVRIVHVIREKGSPEQR